MCNIRRLVLALTLSVAACVPSRAPQAVIEPRPSDAIAPGASLGFDANASDQNLAALKRERGELTVQVSALEAARDDAAARLASILSRRARELWTGIAGRWTQAGWALLLQAN